MRDAVRNGAIALAAMHDLNLALRVADTVVVLGAGRVLSAGPPAEAVTMPILREAYGVDRRVEHCSRGYPIVVIDGVTPDPSPMSEQR